jgi:predicted N-acetyltransferase YhbS
MTEIRPIDEAESSRFLEVLCTVFDLDPERASSVFFSEPFYDPSFKWALFQGGEMVSILSLTPLQFGWGTAMGISGVATLPEHRGRGLAGRLMESVLDRIAMPTMLFAHRPDLYIRSGYIQVDTVVRGTIVDCKGADLGTALPRATVEVLYSNWARTDPARLQRDDRRWKYWSWTLRSCEALDDGYLGIEASFVREAIGIGARSCWPVGSDIEWIGLRSITEQIKVPLMSQEETLIVMARNFPLPPQMFMSDQF